jgi:hypothetical protein
LEFDLIFLALKCLLLIRRNPVNYCVVAISPCWQVPGDWELRGTKKGYRRYMSAQLTDLVAVLDDAQLGLDKAMGGILSGALQDSFKQSPHRPTPSPFLLHIFLLCALFTCAADIFSGFEMLPVSSHKM